MKFIDSLKHNTLSSDEIAVYWLGQAGFLIVTPQGNQIAIDPYFSDAAYHMFSEYGYGFKRLTPPVCSPSELNLSVLLISHEHCDHFDADSLRDLIRSETEIYTNRPTAEQIIEMGINPKQVHVLKKNIPEKLEDFALLPVDCDHGFLAPEALGFILDFGGSKLYYSGDTALAPERLSIPISFRPDVAILPINGAYGNLDSLQAAQYANMLKCKICIPCHFWTFPIHRGDPQILLDCIADEAPGCQVRVLCQGEAYLMKNKQK